jgi:hypothetical protein
VAAVANRWLDMLDTQVGPAHCYLCMLLCSNRCNQLRAGNGSHLP